MGPKERGRKRLRGSRQHAPQVAESAECGKPEVTERLVDRADEVEYELETEEGADAGEFAG
jgi:hypothetical protein